MGVFMKLRDDERGSMFARVAAMVAAPIVLFTIATAAITVSRTGANMTEAVTRSTTATTLLEDLRATVGFADTVTVTADKKVVSILKKTAGGGANVSSFESTASPCMRSTFWFEPAGSLATLHRTIENFDNTGCTGSPVSSVATSLTGLKPGAKFTFFNRGGMELTGHTGSFTIAGGTMPAHVPTSMWLSTDLAQVSVDAVMQETFGEKPLRATVLLPTPYL